MTKNSDRFAEVMVGLFMTVVLALLAYFTIIISGVDMMFGQERTHVKVAFSDVGGLKERDNVVYRGMKAGVVERIAIEGTNIIVTIAVNSNLTLRRDSHFSVSPLSLLGGNALTIEEGTGEILPLEGTLFTGDRPLDWMRDLGQIARRLNDLTESGSLRSIMTNAEATAQNLNAIIARVERGEGTLGKLFSKDDTLYRDLSATASRVSEIADRLARGEGVMGGLLSTNDTLLADLKAGAKNIREITQAARTGEGLLPKLLHDKQMADAADKVVQDTDTLVRNADKMIADLKAVSERLSKGEGTLGKLAKDPELYDQVNALVSDIRQIVDNYRDTTPISTFGSLALGAL